ncbi:MAG: asparagine synthase (glutamine-hydrolyzing) [Rhodospirillales bacterium]|nr:asparagine synthase (glutamine-hydrolyzing) [Rhodospirillales bacterium]MBO6786002.1 asparagine synthase (glutamine-hydrolyzing) [Rhodospirillales bacterium]
MDRRGAVSQSDLLDSVTRMAAALSHRGPDGEGVWADAGEGVAFGFRRLAIMDPSPAGDQPMLSVSGRYRMVFNGEIYNFEDLRAELIAAGGRFESSGDTAVLLAAFEHWGIKETLPRLNGMFAIALWDSKENALHLVRDRVGVKPLYWGRLGKAFAFASELSAILAGPDAGFEVDPGAKEAFLMLGYVPAPLSIVKGIEKLLPGQGVTAVAGREPSRWSWWALADAGCHTYLEDDDPDATFERLLHDAVKRRTRADVPVGAFLSGGYDSTAVAAALVATGHQDLRFYTIGFEEAGYDERPHAEAVAKHLGVGLHTQLLTGKDAGDLGPRIADWFDEPFADSSQFPMAAVSAMARRDVSVALSGDGGDELFAGYTRHLWADGKWRHLIDRPNWQLRALEWGGRHAPTLTNALMPASSRPSSGPRGIQFIAALLAARTPSDWHGQITAIGERAALPEAWFKVAQDVSKDPLMSLRYIDFMRYLPDDILVKLDRSSMAVGLEARDPLLDYRLVEFAFGLDRGRMIANGLGKTILRKYVHRYVPESKMKRPKQGFSIPLGAWLRGPLKAYVDDCLLGENGAIAEYSHIEGLWRAHLAGRADHGASLWAHVQLVAWQRRFGL